MIQDPDKFLDRHSELAEFLVLYQRHHMLLSKLVASDLVGRGFAGYREREKSNARALYYADVVRP